MIQTSLDSFFAEKVVKEDAQAVLQELSGPCTLCRLGQESPDNGGVIWKGSLKASIAIVGDMPNELDMKARIAFGSDEEIRYLKRWLEIAGIDTKDALYTYTVQCQTPSHASGTFDTEGNMIYVQRAPAKDELQRCFAPRCLRILKAMANLEVVMCLGIDVLKPILGGYPMAKSHFGYWFGTDLLPEVAIFGLPHPREFDSTTGPLRHGRVRQKLEFFKTEYYGRAGDAATSVLPRKIMRILEAAQAERKELRSV